MYIANDGSLMERIIIRYLIFLHPKDMCLFQLKVLFDIYSILIRTQPSMLDIDTIYKLIFGLTQRRLSK